MDPTTFVVGLPGGMFFQCLVNAYVSSSRSGSIGLEKSLELYKRTES